MERDAVKNEARKSVNQRNDGIKKLGNLFFISGMKNDIKNGKNLKESDQVCKNTCGMKGKKWETSIK